MKFTMRDVYVAITTLIVTFVVIPAVWNYWVVGSAKTTALVSEVIVQKDVAVVMPQPQIPVQVVVPQPQVVVQQAMKRSGPICNRNPGDYFDPKDGKCHTSVGG